MTRDASSFGRNSPYLRQQPLVLVICEDEKSSKDYLTDAKVHYRATAMVDVANVGHSDPRGIVRKAIQKSTKFDQVFCVIDRDTHPTFNEAVALARENPKVVLITSYPCFEYWLYLHFKYTRRTFRRSGVHSPADQMIGHLKKCEGMKNYDKGQVKSLFKTLLPRLPNAFVHAARSVNDAAKDGESDPSTQLHLVLEKFAELGKTVKL